MSEAEKKRSPNQMGSVDRDCVYVLGRVCCCVCAMCDACGCYILGKHYSVSELHDCFLSAVVSPVNALACVVTCPR